MSLFHYSVNNFSEVFRNVCDVLQKIDIRGKSNYLILVKNKMSRNKNRGQTDGHLMLLLPLSVFLVHDLPIKRSRCTLDN